MEHICLAELETFVVESVYFSGRAVCFLSSVTASLIYYQNFFFFFELPSFDLSDVAHLLTKQNALCQCASALLSPVPDTAVFNVLFRCFI